MGVRITAVKMAKGDTGKYITITGQSANSEGRKDPLAPVANRTVYEPNSDMPNANQQNIWDYLMSLLGQEDEVKGLDIFIDSMSFVQISLPAHHYRNPDTGKRVKITAGPKKGEDAVSHGRNTLMFGHETLDHLVEQQRQRVQSEDWIKTETADVEE